MNGLLFLTEKDFGKGITASGKNVITLPTISGFSLVLFYSTQCENCKELIPIFKKLPGKIGGCQFGIINIIQNKKVIHMCKNTVTPIKYVPFMLLFFKGKPYMKYNGPYDIDEIARFVMDVSSKVMKSGKITMGGNISKDEEYKEILVYANPKLAKPTVCYIKF